MLHYHCIESHIVEKADTVEVDIVEKSGVYKMAQTDLYLGVIVKDIALG